MNNFGKCFKYEDYLMTFESIMFPLKSTFYMISTFNRKHKAHKAQKEMKQIKYR